MLVNLKFNDAEMTERANRINELARELQTAVMDFNARMEATVEVNRPADSGN